MDYNLFKIVGAVAGIGGVALASVVYIFREVIRKEIFPQLTKEQAGGLLNLIVVLIFIIGVLGIIAYVTLSWVNKPSAPPAVLTGRVFNKNNTNERIRDARVSLDGDGPPSLTTTDSEGVFKFSLSDPNKEVLVRVEADGFEPFALRVIPAKNLSTQPIPLVPQSDTISQLYGYIYDRDDTPLEGAEVWLEDFPEMSHIKTATNGGFQIKDIPRKYGEWVRLRAVKEGYYPHPCIKDLRLGAEGSRIIYLSPYRKPSRLPC